MKEIPCKRVFSNGMECEWFIEHNCEKGCTRFRKGRCRVYNAIFDAMWDKSRFPFDDLLEYEGYAGMRCKRFTDIPSTRKRHDNPINGQYELIDEEGF